MIQIQKAGVEKGKGFRERSQLKKVRGKMQKEDGKTSHNSGATPEASERRFRGGGDLKARGRVYSGPGRKIAFEIDNTSRKNRTGAIGQKE